MKNVLYVLQYAKRYKAMLNSEKVKPIEVSLTDKNSRFFKVQNL